MFDFKKGGIADFRKGLLNKQFSAKEAVDFYLQEIEKKDGEIGAWLDIWKEDAWQQAKEVDEMIAKDNPLPYLAGAPIGIKDIILVKGREFTAGSKMLAGYKAVYDATVVERLRNEKAVLLGRTNMDEFAFGSSTENSAWQVTKNPHDKSRVSGGTSGGSAAVVADGMVLAALGTDTGGSVRQPASFCGVTGLRPTYGAVSRYGVVSAASSFDQVGPIGRGVEDVAILFKAIAGRDKFDARTALDYGDLSLSETVSLKGRKIGLPKELLEDGKENWFGLDERTRKEIKKAIDVLKKAGADLRVVEIPHIKYSLATYYVSIFAEESSNLSRYDGLRYPASSFKDDEAVSKELFEVYKENRDAGFGQEAKRRIILGTFVLSSGYYESYYGRAQKVRQLLQHDLDRVLNEVEAVFMPVAPTVAFKVGEKEGDPLAMYYGDVFTVVASLAGLPALSIPSEPFGSELTGLPVGWQLMGRAGGELDLFKMGRAYEREMGY